MPFFSTALGGVVAGVTRTVTEPLVSSGVLLNNQKEILQWNRLTRVCRQMNRPQGSMAIDPLEPAEIQGVWACHFHFAMIFCNYLLLLYEKK